MAGFFEKIRSLFKHGLNAPWVKDTVSKSGLGTSFESFWNSVTKTSLTGSEREANAWTAEREDTTHQRAVADMQAAGLNPALMYGNGAAPSFSSAQSVTPSGAGGSLTDLIQLFTLPKQMKMMQAQINNTNANTAKTETETDWLPTLLNAEAVKDLSGAELDKARTTLTGEQTAQVIQNYQFAAKFFDLDYKAKEETVNHLIKINELTDEQIKTEVSKRGVNDATIRKISADIGLTDAQTMRIIALLPEELLNMQADTALKYMQSEKYSTDIMYAAVYAAAASESAAAQSKTADAAEKNAQTNEHTGFVDTMLKWRESDWNIFFKKLGIGIDLTRLDLEQRYFWINAITGAVKAVAEAANK